MLLRLGARDDGRVEGAQAGQVVDADALVAAVEHAGALRGDAWKPKLRG